MLRPGDYRIDANPDSQTTIITVRDGEGEVTGGGDAFPVYARQQVAVRGDDQIDYSLALRSWSSMHGTSGAPRATAAKTNRSLHVTFPAK